MWQQSTCTLSPRPRGVHLITESILHHAPALHGVRAGLLHLFLQHTSAALALNENTSADVRIDLNAYFNMIAPDGARHYTHRLEGPDDMPAHIKAVLVGPSLSLPVTNGAVAMGAWQGIYLLEFRNHGGPRRIIITLMGE